MKLKIEIRELRETKAPMRNTFKSQVDRVMEIAMDRTNKTDVKTWNELYEFSAAVAAIQQMTDILGNLDDAINQLVELGCKVLADASLKPADYRSEYDEYVKAGNKVIYRLDSIAKDVLRDPSYEMFNVIWSKNIDALARLIGMDEKSNDDGKPKGDSKSE